MTIEYKVNVPITLTQFTQLLADSGLGRRRPIDDPVCLQGMLDNANLTISAWSGAQLVGIARSMTDFHYACYLSDLAVSELYKNAGVGKQLLAKTEHHLQPTCKLILIAAPAANEYYAKLDYDNHPRCWVKTLAN